MIKKILSLSLFILLVAIVLKYPSLVKAQGYVQCLPATGGCDVDNHCAPNYIPPTGPGGGGYCSWYYQQYSTCPAGNHLCITPAPVPLCPDWCDLMSPPSCDTQCSLCYYYSTSCLAPPTGVVAPNPTIAPYTGYCTPSGGFANGINTALGCIPFDNPSAMAAFFIKVALGIGGGIAFLMIVFAGFMMTTSRGDPGRVKAAQELLTSAIAGLLLIIFSVFLLRFLGVFILNVQMQLP